jgi:cytochrome c
MKMSKSLIHSLLLLLLCTPFAVPAGAGDDKKIKKDLRKQDCFKCHSMTRDKDGPSFKATAERYRGDSQAADKLVTHLTTEPEVEVDGNKEKHKNYEGDARLIADWLLGMPE